MTVEVPMKIHLKHTCLPRVKQHAPTKHIQASSFRVATIPGSRVRPGTGRRLNGKDLRTSKLPSLQFLQSHMNLCHNSDLHLICNGNCMDMCKPMVWMCANLRFKLSCVGCLTNLARRCVSVCVCVLLH